MFTYKEYEGPATDNPFSEITLRDRFAMAALTGILAGAILPNDRTKENMAAIPGSCYALADAMLRAREKKE